VLLPWGLAGQSDLKRTGPDNTLKRSTLAGRTRLNYSGSQRRRWWAAASASS